MSKLLKYSLLITSILTIIAISSSLSFARPVFEKGDAIYRELGHPWWIPSFFPVERFGHAGIYYGWPPPKSPNPESPNPDDLSTHQTFEAFGYSGSFLNPHSEPDEEVGFGTFDEFHAREFLSVRTKFGLTYENRRDIVDFAEKQDDCVYDFFEGYKNPEGKAWRSGPFPPFVGKLEPSFRCDGLIEWLYEQVGIDIIPNDIWGAWSLTNMACLQLAGKNILSPRRQMNSLDLRSEATPPKVKILGFDSDNRPVAYAGDGEYGSGVTRVEFYNGPPDDGTLIGVNEDKKDAGDYYTCPNVPEEPLSLNNLWVRAYDQAGNSETAKRELVQLTNSINNPSSDNLGSDNPGPNNPDLSTNISSESLDSSSDNPFYPDFPSSPEERRKKFLERMKLLKEGKLEPGQPFSFEKNLETNKLESSGNNPDSQSDSSPLYSPDGKRIAFLRKGYENGNYYSHLWIMNSDGSGLRETGNSEILHKDSDFKWSPDGEKIAFIRESDEDGDGQIGYYYDDEGCEHEEVPQLWVINLETGQEKQLTSCYSTSESIDGGGNRVKIKNG